MISYPVVALSFGVGYVGALPLVEWLYARPLRWPSRRVLVAGLWLLALAASPVTSRDMSTLIYAFFAYSAGSIAALPRRPSAP